MQRFTFSAGILIAVLSLVACKKNGSSSSSSSSQSGPDGFLPAPAVYSYVSTGSDGSTGTETVTASALRDTAGGHAVTLQAVIGSNTQTTIAYADATHTIFPITASAEFDSLATIFQALAGVSDFSYSGWPVVQSMANTGAKGDALTFSGGPIHMHWVETGNGESLTADYYLTYQDGSAIASGVPVTTAAGTFTCSEWVYSKQVKIQLGPIDSTANYTDTLWMTPGKSFIKSTELGAGIYSVTVLNKIN